MQSQFQIRSRNKNSRQRRGAALYILVVTMSVLISMIGLAGMNLMRLQRDQMLTGVEMQRARLLSRSAVELGLDQLKNDPNWRTSYSNGGETTPSNVHASVNGTISWIVQDSDGNLQNADVALKLLGIGRIDNTVQVTSIDLMAQETFGPQVFRNYTSLLSLSVNYISSNNSAGQYFKATLPAEAISWKITEIDLYCMKNKKDKTVAVRICQPDAFNIPTATNYDSLTFLSNDAPVGLPGWVTFSFSGETTIDADDGVCLMLESDSLQAPIQYFHKQGDLTAINSAYIAGPPDFLTSYSDSSLVYEVRGVYYTDTANGPFAVAGTWQWASAP